MSPRSVLQPTYLVHVATNIFFFFAFIFFTDRSRLLLLCIFPALAVLGDLGGGVGVFLLVTVFRYSGNMRYILRTMSLSLLEYQTGDSWQHRA